MTPQKPLYIEDFLCAIGQNDVDRDGSFISISHEVLQNSAEVKKNLSQKYKSCVNHGLL